MPHLAVQGVGCWRLAFQPYSRSFQPTLGRPLQAGGLINMQHAHWSPRSQRGLTHLKLVSCEPRNRMPLKVVWLLASTAFTMWSMCNTGCVSMAGHGANAMGEDDTWGLRRWKLNRSRPIPVANMRALMAHGLLMASAKVYGQHTSTVSSGALSSRHDCASTGA